jgi:DUF2934 family protein
MQMNNDSTSQTFEAMHFAANATPHSETCLPALIRARAYELFEGRGRHPGHGLDDWIQAEREIRHHLGL